MSLVEVSFRYLESGWRTERRSLEEEEVQSLLKDAVIVNCSFLDGCWSKFTKLEGIVLKLKDGRKCTLTEINESVYDSSNGWISIHIDEEWDEN